MSIAQNKKAFHDYFIEEKYEAGIVLEGWEVKAIRENRIQLKEAYVIIQRGEIYLIGCHVTPLGSASTHVRPDAIRTRKLLLHNEQIAKLIGKVERAGYTWCLWICTTPVVVSRYKLAWPKVKSSTTSAPPSVKKTGSVSKAH